MTQTSDRIAWTPADLALFPEDSNRYEIIDGDLFTTPAPNWKHQKAATRLSTALDTWSETTQLGEVVQAPGILFSDADNVIPDVAWVTKARLADILDEAGHLTAAPELIIECLSYGGDNERRDRQLKLKLYSARGVLAYWIVDWKGELVEIYHRQGARLTLLETLRPGDTITCSLLPGFAMDVTRLFA